MTESVVDRSIVEAFIEACGDTNFQVIARGSGVEGAVTPTLKKATHYNFDGPKTTMYRQANGLRSGLTVNGQMRVWRQAAELAEGNDWYRAIVALIECGYYDHVELHALEHISVADKFGEQHNPVFSELKPLIWRCEDDGKVTTHGGAREGSGRKPWLKDPVTLTFKVNGETYDRIKARAKAEDRSSADLLREMAEKL